MKKRLSLSEYIDGIISGNRMILSRAITLIESNLPSDKKLAQEVIEAILPHTGKSVRLGITGVPGVGKSTFIEALGKYLTISRKKLRYLPSTQVLNLPKAVFWATKPAWSICLFIRKPISVQVLPVEP